MKALLWIVVIAGVIWLVRRSFMAKPAMTADEAARLLDVSAQASAEDVQAAHRRLIARVHPDAGGSAELAARVNRARDILLARNRVA